MINSTFKPKDNARKIMNGTAPQPVATPGKKRKRKSISMHDGVAVWCDCCSCEAEPYWAELAEELGVDLGSDYEDQEIS